MYSFSSASRRALSFALLSVVALAALTVVALATPRVHAQETDTTVSIPVVDCSRR